MMKPINAEHQQTTGQTAAPVQLPVPVAQQLPATQPLAPPSPDLKLNLSTLLGVLRRRWFLSLALGLPLAAVAGYGAWSVIPTPYSANRSIHIRAHVAHVPGRKNADGPKHKDLKATHMQLIRDPEVLSVALNQKGIAQLPALREVEENQPEWLAKQLKVSNNGAEFFRIEISGHGPDEMVKILNAVTDAYFTKVVGADLKELQLKREIYRELLDSRESALKRRGEYLKKNAEKSSPNEKQADQKQLAILEHRADLLKQIDEIDGQVFEYKFLIRYRDKNPAKQTVPAQAIDDLMQADPKYAREKQHVDELEKRLEYFKATVHEGHPRLKKIREDSKKASDEFAKLKKRKETEIREKLLQSKDSRLQQSKEQLQNQIDFQLARKKALEDKLKEIGDQLAKQNRGVVELEADRNAFERLEAEVQTLTKLVADYDTEMQIRAKQPRIEKWGDPKTTGPDQKKQIMGTAVAGLGAFGLVLFAIGFVDIRSRRLNSVNQVVDTVGIRLLGAVPLIPRAATARQNGKWSAKARYWHGAMTESIDATRTVLQSQAVGNVQVFMVTSAAPREGKTTTSCHLATSLARAGNHVLLVDADMRHPHVHSTFGLTQGPGLAEILRGEISTDEAVQPSGIARMPVLSAGGVDSRTLELLAQGRLGELIEGWRQKFDYVVIDSPPILPVADGLLIAQHADGVVFTVRRDVSRVGKVVAACQRLSLIGVPLLGAVGIGLDQDSYGYRGGYSYYGDTSRSA